MKKSLIILLIYLIPLFSQQLKWVYTYNGSKDSADAARKIIFGDGNLYIGGHTTNILQQTDITVICLDTLGNQKWVYVYPYPGRDYLNDMVYKNGKIYITGSLESEGVLIVICLDSLGNSKWNYIYDTQNNDAGYSIIYGIDKNLYIAGRCSSQFTVISIDTLGNLRWKKSYPASTGGNSANYLTQDENANIYVSGIYESDLFLVKLDNLGNEKWTYKYSTSLADGGGKIIYGYDKNLYLIGTVLSTEGLVLSLDTLGNEKWLYFFIGPNSYSNSSGFSSIILSPDGNLYFSGWAGYAPWYSGWFTMSMSNSGIWRWSYYKTIVGKCIETLWKEDGSLYSLGIESFKITLRKISSINGEEIWTYQYTQSSRSDGNSMELKGNKIYIAGSQGIFTTQDILVICIEDMSKFYKGEK